MNRLHAFLWLVAALTLAGCNSNPPTAQVTGTVNYDGAPLKEGTIIFETTGSRPATGKIVDGKIVEMTTYAPGDGVPLGSHKVAVHAIATGGSAVAANPGDASSSLDSMKTTSLIPAKYNDPATSGLTAEIKAGANPVTFDLKKEM